MKPSDNIEEAIKKELDFSAGAEMHDRILGDVLDAHDKSRKEKSALTSPNLRRQIMKSPITKLAAAAVIIIAVLIGLNPFKGTVTFADVIEPILNARTVVLDLVVGSEETGLVVHDIVVGSKIRRTLPNMGIAIIDLDNARLLRLDPLDKSAVYIDIQGPFRKGMKNYLGLVQVVSFSTSVAGDVSLNVLLHGTTYTKVQIRVAQCVIVGQRIYSFLIALLMLERSPLSPPFSNPVIFLDAALDHKSAGVA